MIVKDGFEGLSMQKLAKAAGVSPATIYIYFKDREDLLNQLYNHCQATFEQTVLKDFDPEMPFREGLWLQWKNRYRFLKRHADEFYFMEQFRSSPLIRHKAIRITPFKEAMGRFVHNAVRRKELRSLSVEAYWSMAYGPFYALMRFHLTQKSITGEPLRLTEKKMRETFDLVVKTLKK